jgi:DNA-binding GntR family transcriptional regulator
VPKENQWCASAKVDLRFIFNYSSFLACIPYDLWNTWDACWDIENKGDLSMLSVFPQGKKLTLSERAYYEIKNMIARRELLPGTPLVLQTLANKLGVSRMPILEAIRRLERDGLVTVMPQWGATVKKWSGEEILDAYCIRRGLEGEAARHFVKRATSKDKERLQELSDLFDKYAASDPLQCDEADLEFHLHIVRSTRLARLYELIENSKIETTLIFGLSLTICNQLDDAIQKNLASIGNHRPIVKALLGQDPEEAVRAVWEHIDLSLEVITKLLEEKDKRSRRQSLADLGMVEHIS